MKLLFLTLGVFYPEGGMERFNQRVLQVLSENNAEIRLQSASIISLRDKTQQSKFSSEKIRFLAFNKKKIPATFGIIKEIKRINPDTYLFGHILFSPVALLIKLLFPSAKNTLFIHGIEAWKKPVLIPSWIYKFSYDRIISVSNFSAERMIQTFKIPQNKFCVIGNAIDITLPTSNDQKDAKPLTNPILVSVSRLSTQSKHKNIDKVICAIPTILAVFPTLKYYIIGDGNWRPELQSLVNEMKLQKFVIFTGAIDDEHKASLLRQADLFILPSTGEGFGIVFLEAWANELAIITSNKGATTEIVDDGVDGICIEPNPHEIAKSAILLLNNPQLMSQMAKKGKDKVINNYSHKNFAKKLIECLNT